ncbi:MAG: chemotaxis protein CheB [Saprospiraceae bacterium]
MKKQVRIVGIGASAGGLEAIYEFFENLSTDTGFAFVIIQHLSPDFKSLMNELLPKHTSMPVEIIENMITPKPNHIYLISAKRNLVIENGIFKPVKRTQTPYLNLPIDVFFQSLGKDQKERAIGIILSGSGTDGSRGVRTIKEQGGLVLAQDPESAQFRSMPDAAIALGLADSVLPPFALARELGRISSLPFQGNITIIDPSIEENQLHLSRILNKVAEISGVDFNEYRKGTLLRRTEKRMMINNFHNLEDYYYFILENEEECQTLFKEFLIGVTRFFRDTEAFELLRSKIIPQIINNTSVHKPIRIWVTGCSTGEEAYSIAILFLEYLEQHKLNRQFKIFATDIDKEAIAFAGAGIYHDNILADVDPTRIRKYFVNQQNIFRVKKIVREKIVFALHDAMKDPPFMNINLVSCRNMLIYLNSNIQQNLLGNFQFALNYEGYLLLGPSESIGQLSGMFKAIDNKWNIYQNISREKVNMSLRGGVRRSRSKYDLGKFESENTFRSNYRPTENKFTTLLSSRFAPLALFVEENFDILYINGNFEAILNLPSGFGKLNLLDMVGENDPLIFKTGLRNVKDSKEVSRYEDFVLVKEGKQLKADIQFERWRPNAKDPAVYLITFFVKEKSVKKVKSKKSVIKQDDFASEQLSLLQLELAEVSQEKQNLVEQLETTNEELQSSNEELLAANEELQSANEELQSVNEELYTVNTELQSKIDELVVVNADTSNLLKSTDIGTVFLDMGLRIRRFTPTLKEQFDLLESDVGRPITNFNHTFNDNKIFEDIAKVLKTLNTLEREITSKNGEQHLMRILPYRTEDNKVDGVVLTFINIEQLHQMTNELKYRSNLFQAVFNNTTAHISIANNKLNIKEINYITPSLNKEIVLGQSIFNFVPTELEDKVQNIIEQLRKKEIIVGTYEMEETLITGEKRWYQYSVIPVYSDTIEPNFIFIGRDITFFKKSSLHLQQLEQQMEQEVQNRLANVISEKQLLATKNDFLESFMEGILTKISEQLPQISSAEKLTTITPLLSRAKELMDYQKDADKLIREIDAKAIFMEVRTALQHRLQTTNATLRYSFGKNRTLRYVKAHFYEILYTLIDNAISYRKTGTPLEIRVKTEQKDDFFFLTVIDNGGGIDLKKDGHLLFKPFSSPADNQKGLGLSLSIIDNLVRKTGGRIEIDSEPNKGSSFKVYIPTSFMPSETVQLLGFSEN